VGTDWVVFVVTNESSEGILMVGKCAASVWLCGSHALGRKLYHIPLSITQEVGIA